MLLAPTRTGICTRKKRRPKLNPISPNSTTSSAGRREEGERGFLNSGQPLLESTTENTPLFCGVKGVTSPIWGFLIGRNVHTEHVTKGRGPNAYHVLERVPCCLIT